jgi:general secretion pathway protein I
MWFKRLSKKDGFTLLEIMIAVAILSSALVAVLQNESRILSSTYESNTLTMASFLALQKLSELESKLGGVDTEMDGTFGKDFPLFTWKAEVRDIPVPGIQAKLLRVSVLWKEGERDRVFTLDRCLSTI